MALVIYAGGAPVTCAVCVQEWDEKYTALKTLFMIHKFSLIGMCRLNLVKIRFSQNAFFIFFFHWRGIYCGQIYHKTCLGILILLPEPQKTAKNVEF